MNDDDLIARTIVGEAANQPFSGQQAVANVILNRLNSGRFGKSARDVVMAPYQFEPWQTRRGELEAIPTDGPAYQSALRALQAARESDPTNGATHFLEPNIVRQRRGGTLPGWAQGPFTAIGNHNFYKPGGGGPTGLSRAPDTTQSTAPQVPFNATPEVPQGNSLPAQKEDDLGALLASMAPQGEQPYILTPAVNTTQIPPFGDAPGEEVDVSAFQPRTTRPPKARNRRA